MKKALHYVLTITVLFIAVMFMYISWQKMQVPLLMCNIILVSQVIFMLLGFRIKAHKANKSIITYLSAFNIGLIVGVLENLF